VQAGAFVDVGNAESLHIRLQAIPVSPVRVQRLVSAGRILQAVRVGPFVSSAKAQQVMSTVLRAGITDARIVIVE
jgi:rare lipoprotein A